MMEELELQCFELISNAGMAKSAYIEAIKMAKKGKVQEAKNKIAEGEAYFLKGHNVHFEIITKEANGKEIPNSLLLIHAEDQLMSAEDFRIHAEEFIDLYEMINTLQ